MYTRKYQFNNSTLTLVFGDITTSKSEVIVSSDDTDITMSGGVSQCILRAGGNEIQRDAQKKLPAQIGDVVVSSSGEMEYQKFIFHSLTIDKKSVLKGNLSNLEEINHYIIEHSVDKCFRLMQALDLNSIAFPCIGNGFAHIPLKKVAEVMADVISMNLCRTQKAYEVELYLYDQNHILSEIDFIDMFENFAVKSAISRYQYNLDQWQYKEEKPSARNNIEVPKREDMNHKVFISYSRKDFNEVETIKSVLEKYEIPYWIDKEGIFSGNNYKEVIVDAIDVSTVVLFVSSVNSNASINVVRELGYAVQQRKTIIPILLDDSPYAKSVRLDIADIDQIEYKEEELAKKKLVASLAYALECK